MDVADLEASAHLPALLRYTVYVLLAIGIGACIAEGANRPADPRLVPVTSVPAAPAAP